jgi:hypothetical protein
LRSVLDHATRRWAQVALQDADDKGDDGATELAEVNAVRAEVTLALSAVVSLVTGWPIGTF